MKISRIKTPPRTKGLPDLVQINILKSAIAMTEENQDLPSHTWRSKGKNQPYGYDDGVGRLMDGEPLVAQGLWAVAAAAADYARLLGKPHEERVKATTDLLFRAHRHLYAAAFATYGTEFVGLNKKFTLSAMRLALANMETHG